MRTGGIERVVSGSFWKGARERVKAPYAKTTSERPGSRVPRGTRNPVGSRGDHPPRLKT